MSLARRKWVSFPTIEIPDSITRKDLKQQPYTSYRILVKDGTQTWNIYKRYNSFYELHEQLKEKFLEKDLPPLPPKPSLMDWTASKIRGRGPDFLDDRRILLEKYLQAILSESHLFQTSEIRAFLEPNENLNVKVKRRKDPEAFLLPPPPSDIVIPKFINLNKKEGNVAQEEADRAAKESTRAAEEDEGSPFVQIPSENGLELIDLGNTPVVKRKVKSSEYCFVVVLLNGIKDGLEFLSTLKKELAAILNPEEAVKALERNRSRMSSTVSALQEGELMLLELLKHCDIISNAALLAYLQTCSEFIQKGLAWRESTEDTLVEQLVSTVQLNTLELEGKVIKMEEEAEKLALVTLVATDHATATADGEQLLADYKRLVKAVKQDLHFFRAQEDVEVSLIKRLEKVEQYLEENFIIPMEDLD